MEITIFQGLWYGLIFLLIAGYFVLDGFDLGAGVVYLFLAKDETDRAIIRRSVGPVWDGNEVWLLTAGGALFAAFPAAYATTFSGFYLAVMLVMFGLILRAVSLEWRHSDPGMAKVWDVCFFVGSLLPALLLGVAVGNIYAGIPMDANGDYSGIPLLGLVTPFTLLTGLLGLAMFISAGTSWISLKAPKESQLRVRAESITIPVQIAALLLFVLVSLYAHFVLHPQMEESLTILRWVCAVVFVISQIIALLAQGRRCNIGSLVGQSVAAVGLVGLLGASLFPNFVVASAESVGVNITAMNAASSELTLMCMTVIACIGVPLVLVYHIIIYRTYRGRISLADLS